MEEKKSLETIRPDIASLPFPSEEEEMAGLARIKQGDADAAEAFKKMNLRYVATVAFQHLGQGLTLDELIEGGNQGLMVAANEYTGSVKRSFVEYAIWRVRKGILYAIAAAQSGNEEPFEVAVYKLTEREREVIQSFNEGKSAAEIAESMKIPESLVTLLYRRGNRKLDHQKKE